MRILVFFDLPVLTKIDRKKYTSFRRFLLKNGFVMIQFSVYAKLCYTEDYIKESAKKLEKNCPETEGKIRYLKLTENQYQSIKLVRGKPSTLELLQNTKKIAIA
ncbi:MAG: CRISPR-associated endonuclease Cas2 [Candidatus Moeniiplasma glomeromycotorum]|nr:CRISPR-associated endonuclease Cas2 [Candidatus Moeniiplasma glomeromycotorum]MCE8168112.1 CRISPR-associated endonuclease Cas2 [Candidatus Moeniiplasma glomeromycotorum]MCE8169954.1 CRISPR-associated endonuclease Cas2 [Candidatus Moeniiplasma glomeromycotorum]